MSRSELPNTSTEPRRLPPHGTPGSPEPPSRRVVAEWRAGGALPDRTDRPPRRDRQAGADPRLRAHDPPAWAAVRPARALRARRVRAPEPLAGGRRGARPRD